MAAALRLFYPGAAPQGQTLDDVYAERLPTYSTSMSDRSKVEQRVALKHWREATGGGVSGVGLRFAIARRLTVSNGVHPGPLGTMIPHCGRFPNV